MRSHCGQALQVEAADIPTKADVRAVIPAHCFKKSTRRSLSYLLQSLVVTGSLALASRLIPLRLAWLPLWPLYAAAPGTAAPPPEPPSRTRSDA